MSGPPEFPGLIGAEVCSKPLKVRGKPLSFEIVSVRLKPETTPTETLSCKANGSPIAIAHWPACTSLERPNSSGGGVGGIDMGRDLIPVCEDRGDLHVGPTTELHDVGVGDDEPVLRIDETRTRRLLVIWENLAGAWPEPEKLRERIGGDVFPPVDRDVERDDRRFIALDCGDDPVLISPVYRDCGYRRRRLRRTGRGREVAARVDHHREASQDRADQPDDGRP